MGFIPNAQPAHIMGICIVDSQHVHREDMNHSYQALFNKVGWEGGRGGSQRSQSLFGVGVKRSRCNTDPMERRNVRWTYCTNTHRTQTRRKTLAGNDGFAK
jgi:hypothetical protein